MKKITTKRVFAGLMTLAVMSLVALPAMAQLPDDPFGVNNVNNNLGLSGADLKLTIIAIIQVILGFLGLLAVIIILWGGFIYMTAAGDTAKVDKAKQMIISGIIGIIIILSAWAITSFVISGVGNALNSA